VTNFALRLRLRYGLSRSKDNQQDQLLGNIEEPCSLDSFYQRQRHLAPSRNSSSMLSFSSKIIIQRTFDCCWTRTSPIRLDSGAYHDAVALQRRSYYRAGGNVVSRTTFSYDEYLLHSTSGTPSQVSVSGSRENVTTINSYSSPTVVLRRHYFYYDTGNIYQATDVFVGTENTCCTETFSKAPILVLVAIFVNS
jgi:hypothetical protein